MLIDLIFKCHNDVTKASGKTFIIITTNTILDLQILAVLLVVVGCSLAQVLPDESYKPFAYNYEVTDELGNVHSEERAQDANGVVTGTMLYRLISGIFRTARYESTPEGGFTITLDSNEPGMGPESPASATFNIEEPPAGSYDPIRRS